MKLDAHQVRQLTESLRLVPASGNTPPYRGEKREDERAGMAGRVQLIPCGNTLNPAALHVSIKDVSAGGIGFVCGQCFAVEDQLILALPPDGYGGPHGVLCTVRYCRQVGDQLFFGGAAFTRLFIPRSQQLARSS